MALGALQIKARTRMAFLVKLEEVCNTLASTRPTAVNLFHALERMKAVAERGTDPSQTKQLLLAESMRIEEENHTAHQVLSRYGAELIQDGFAVLTHCNAGALATAAGYGSALGVVQVCLEQGKKIHVFVPETRPLLQGSRLTAWELKEQGIPFTLITDNMVGHFLHRCRVNCVVVGADRIAANGDVANKIGTYSLAVLAQENGVPFYVAAPGSSIDLSLPSGDAIPIEERSPREVTHIEGVIIAPQGVVVANPAFDVTPHYYVSGIITEKGVLREPYQERLGKAKFS
jgi:methylthioribose-1-phosphate isomerase